MKKKQPLFIIAFISIIAVLCACHEDTHEQWIVFERGRMPDYCVPFTTPEGDQVFNKFKKFILERRKSLGEDRRRVWRIYGPLKCGHQVSFFANKDLEIIDGRVSLEVGSHFTVNYNKETNGFEIIGGM